MAIGIVTDDLFESELESFKKKDVVIEKIPKKGRKEGDTNVPESLRKIIGEEAVINGREAALELAKDFGVSASSVSAYAKGATSTKTYDTPKESIISHINKSRARHIKKASKVLHAALGAITQDKLDYTDAKDLSGIARDMAAVIKQLEPPQVVESNDGKSGPQFVIFAPQFRKEESFEVIDLSRVE